MLSAEFWSGAVKYWESDAINTLGHLERDEIVVIGAPWGSGKSRLFSRALEKVCAARSIVSTSSLRDGVDQPVTEYYKYFLENGMPLDLAIEVNGPSGQAILEADRLLVWFEEPPVTGISQEMWRVIAWKNKRGSQGQDTYFVINGVGRTRTARQEDVVRIINSAGKSDTLAFYYELRRTHLPRSYVAPALEDLGVTTELIDFISDPDNKAMRVPRMIGYLYGDFMAYFEGRKVEDLPPAQPKTLVQLRDYLGNIEQVGERSRGLLRSLILFDTAMGGSAEDLVQTLLNLGIFDVNPEAGQLAREMIDDKFGILSADRDRIGNDYLHRLLTARFGSLVDHFPPLYFS